MISELDPIAGISAGRRKMLRALCLAKSQLYEAHHQAKEETSAEMADRVWAVFNQADRLFCDERNAIVSIQKAADQAMDLEYGPVTFTNQG